MAGTFTHWMVVEEALDKYRNLIQEIHPYFSIITEYSHFVSLGAVGPDYPYLTELGLAFFKEHSWANRMHYERSGDFIRIAIGNLPSNEAEGFKPCLAWLCGFASHLVTDSVVHPVVQAIVGPYIFNSKEHRHCELTQDSYIFKEITNLELRYADYEKLFKMCSIPEDTNKLNPDLAQFWTKTLKETHPQAEPWFDKIRPDEWHEKFLSRIASAADPVPVFRHFAEEEDLAYKTTDEFTAEEVESFIEQIKLPGNKIGKFKTDAFDKAVDKVIETWQNLFVDIEKRPLKDTITYIKNWNLDTGVDEDDQYFWPKSEGKS